MQFETVRVLMVEDNRADARLVEEALAESGSGSFVFKHADSLGQALALLNRERFDVMLLDLSLPDAWGLDSLTEVEAVMPDLPIVVLSGFDDEDLALRAVHSGAQDYLVKGQGSRELLTRALRYAIERKGIEKRLSYLAQYDTLTDLPNRLLFRDRLTRALSRIKRRHRLAALMFLDLDHFKDINDTLGHDAGDELLRAASARLKSCVRQDDTVARLGGDEFTVILEEIAHKEEAAMVADKIIATLSQPFSFRGEEIFVSASVGIVTFDSSAEDAETLIKHADMALYAAKEHGRAIYRFYDSEMNSVVARRITVAASLRRALEREEFVLHYQPQFDLLSGQLVGVEALLRWRHPAHGLVGPAQFVHLLEENGLIVPVGEWALRSACLQYRVWHASGLRPFRLAVNLSPRQVRQNRLVKSVLGVLVETGMDPRNLQLEVTESLLMTNTGETLATLRDLHAAGLQLSIDDFGTGYSSLNYLRRFPFHALKVDRSFVKDIASDPDGAAIVAAVITLAHSLRLRVVAEGVERESELAFLSAEGCDEVQGYLLCHPMPADELDAWMQARQGHAAREPWRVTSS